MKRPFIFACAAIALALVSGCGKKEEPAATINGDPISLAEFHKYLELKPSVQIIVNPQALQINPGGGPIPQQPFTGPVVGSIGLQALNDLVQQTILRQMARDEGVEPSSGDIETELKDRTKQQADYVRNLVNNGFTMDMIRKDIALQMCQYNLTTRGITVTDDEVNKYITDHPNDFIVPESVDLVWMLVTDEKTRKAADADLKAGQAFINVAQKYSAAPNARATQYRFPERSIPRLAAYGRELMPSVQKTPEQQETPWLKFTEGWAKFYVSKKYPSQKLTIDDAMKKRVQRAIALQKGSQSHDVNKRVQEKLRTANIIIGSALDHLKDPWKRSMESLNNSAANTGAPSSAPQNSAPAGSTTTGG